MEENELRRYYRTLVTCHSETLLGRFASRRMEMEYQNIGGIL